MVKRYHGLIRRVYQIIAIELPDLDKDIALQIAFKAINDTTSLDSLVPILLVFGVYLRIIKLDVPSLIVTQHATITKKAIVEI